MYGVLGEDASDFETLKVLIRRLADDEKTPVKGKGCKGGAELLKHGWRDLKSLAGLGCTHFVIAHDADQKPVKEVERELAAKIIKPSGVKTGICLLVPVQEIEAWLLADLAAASKIFPGWRPQSEANPESLARPKEHLEKLSRQQGGRPRYSHATHNPKLAEHVNLAEVAKRCQSFLPLEAFVRQGKVNHPPA